MRCTACNRICEPWDTKPPKPDGTAEDLCTYCIVAIEEANNPCYDPCFRQFEDALPGLHTPRDVD